MFLFSVLYIRKFGYGFGYFSFRDPIVLLLPADSSPNPHPDETPPPSRAVTSSSSTNTSTSPMFEDRWSHNRDVVLIVETVDDSTRTQSNAAALPLTLQTDLTCHNIGDLMKTSNLKLGVDVIGSHNLFPRDGQGTTNAFVELYFDDPSGLHYLTLEGQAYSQNRPTNGRSFLGKVSLPGTPFVPHSDAVILHFPMEKRGVQNSNNTGSIR
ncbi:hypothetical protein HID58_017464 [Brassica napus]|uniref:Uncharacterized protein n=1 Tax=Brassica napus TaxID=3708 RepID=A0ABQ8D8W1_BRANA|nr:hypothetical protein HID58_017464 [Brassica napus]